MSKPFQGILAAPSPRTKHISVWDTSIGSGEEIRAFDAFTSESLITFDYRYALPSLSKALTASPVKINVFKLDNDEDSSLKQSALEDPQQLHLSQSRGTQRTTAGAAFLFGCQSKICHVIL